MVTVKRFRVESPEQLRALATGFCLWGETLVKNAATIWSVGRRDGEMDWDRAFEVRFESERFGSRKAYIDSCKSMIAELKYNGALAFCRNNLQMVEEATHDKD